jgi:two-component system, cell cycle response regulator
MARILVIEDNPINLELMTYLLRAWGHEVLSASDGVSGLAAARREQPDLLVCDIQMPGLDGYEVARQIKADAALRSVPLLAVTALAMVGDRDRALRAGFNGHIAKPIEPAAFMAALDAFLPDPSTAPVPPRTASSPELAQRPLPAALRAPRAGLVVLMVDDTEANLAFKLSLLEPAGYTVLTASGGCEALEIARSREIDAILADVMMAEGNGFELLRAVRADPALRGKAFLFLTATARDEASRAHGLALGADAYLVRPIEPQQLLGELRARLTP